MAAKRTKWIVIGIIVGLVVAGMWVAAFMIVAGGGGGLAGRDYDERLVTEGTGERKIAMVSMAGPILAGGETCAQDFVADNQILAELDQAISDDEVAGVILDLNTPGGGVVASDNIHRKVLEVRRRHKPVVALMGEVAASGGYYVASATDEIVANPTTITGSIGVILLVPNFEGTASKIGLSVEVIKSGPHKDIASSLRELSEAERKILQRLIDEAYAQFVAVVAQGRRLDEPRVREIADGRIYSGKQALELGLVDRLGDRTLALERARHLARSPGADLVRYECSEGLSEILQPFARSRRDLVEEGLGVELPAGLSYLWIG